MNKKIITVSCLFFFAITASAQVKKPQLTGFPNSVEPVGIIQGLSDSALLETVQRQTFRYFWHGAHPVSGLALERSNTVLAEYYWEYINEDRISGEDSYLQFL